MKKKAPQKTVSMEELLETESRWEKVKRFMRTNKLATASLFFIVFIILVAIFAPVFAPYDPYAQNTENQLMPPSFEHWLGTDELGRDVLSRIIYGARISLIIGLVPTSLSMMLGILLGLMAGYLGKWVDNIIMRFADIMLAFPSLLLAMVVTYTLGSGIVNIFIALSLVNWAGTARIGPRPDHLPKRGGNGRGGAGYRREQMENHVPAYPSKLSAFADCTVYAGYPGSILSESSLSFLGSRGHSRLPQAGASWLQGERLSFYRALVGHCARRHHPACGAGL